MRIGIIGPELTAGLAAEVAAKNFPAIAVSRYQYTHFEQAAAIAASVQSAHEVDALLFTGPSLYERVLRRVRPTIPWACLPHSRISLLRALAEAALRYGNVLSPVSVDRYSAEMVRDTLASLGIAEPVVLRAELDEESDNLPHLIREFHRSNVRSGQAVLCLTSTEHITEHLEPEGIPCVRILPAEETIVEELTRLYNLHLSMLGSRGLLAVVAVRCERVPDEEEGLPGREWDSVLALNRFRELVYASALRLRAGVFCEGPELFYVVTVRDLLEKEFLKNRGYLELLRFETPGTRFRVRMGIGLGDTMLQARALSAQALRSADEERTAASILLDSGSDAPSRLPDAPEGEELGTLTALAHRIGLSESTLLRLTELEPNRAMTSEELAAALGVTRRSANRILAHLEEGGFVRVVGKEGSGRGRPTRRLRIDLPGYLRTQTHEE